MPVKATKVLSNANDVLLLLAERGPLGPADIARLTDMPRPSVYRLLEALEVVGLVGTGADGRAELGLRNLQLAEASLTAIPELTAARPFLDELAERFGQTVYYCVRRDSRIICLDWVQGERLTLLALTPGNSLPLHAGATSRAITAAEPRVLASLGSNPTFERFTPFTLTTLDELAADAAEITERGYSISDQDVTIGVAAIGAAVVDARGRLRGAISLAGLRDQVLDGAEAKGLELRKAAAEIATALSN